MLKNKDLHIYCRVSTSGQEESGSSLDVQEQRGRKLSEKLDLKPIVIKEQGSGMKPYDPTRPLFSKLMEDIEDGLVKNVWIDDETRLTRFDVDQQFIHIQMKKLDVNLYVGTSSKPKKWDWITDLVDTIITKVNQNQIKLQVRKSIRSKRKLFEEGYYMKGDPPFGYKLVDRTLEIHDVNSDWVRKIFNWYDQGKSTYWIRTELFNNSIQPNRSKTGMFPLQTINKMLTNKNYIGIDTYRELTGECPKIIDRDLFDRVQKNINKGLSKRNETIKVKTNFLVRDLIVCPDGQKMSVKGKSSSPSFKGGKGHEPRYLCNHRVRLNQKRITSHDCPIERNLRSELVDQYVWDLLVDVLSNSHQIREKTKQELLGSKKKYTKRTYNNNIKRLTKKIQQLEDNQLELDKKYYGGEMDKKKYDVLSKVIKDNDQQLVDEIQINQIKLDQIQNEEKWIDWLEIHHQRMDDLRREKDFDTCKNIVQHYLSEIRVLEYNQDTLQHTLSVKFKFPLFKDQFNWIKNKDGSFKRDKFGQRVYEIVEGEKEKVNPTELHYLLHRDTMDNVVQFSYLIVYVQIVSHKFSPSPYFTHKHDRKSIHNRINELRSEGLGYKRIHKVLVREKFDIGSSPTCVDHMIKKLDRRDMILNQRDEIDFVKVDFQIIRS